jgi:pilus assembly protein CpaE
MNMMPLTAALIVPHRALWEQTHLCIQTLPVRIAVEQNEPCEPDALLDRIERHRVDVVLVEVAHLPVPLEEFVRRLRNTPTRPAVFVLHPEASPDLILEALRAGATEYLYLPLTESLKTAFEKLSVTRAHQGSGGPRALGKIFGFLSARGGCGATTLAIHVASALGRGSKENLLLADFDFDAGLLRFLMKSKSVYSVRDALDNMNRMDSSYWKALVSSPAPNIDFIAAPDDLAARRASGSEEMKHLMRFIRSVYATSVVDFGRNVSRAALDSIPELETLYIVTNPDTETLEQTRKAMALAERHGCPASKIKVLLNKVPDKPVIDRRATRTITGVDPVASFTDEGMALYDAYSEGRLLEPGNPLARQIHSLADAIRGVEFAAKAAAAQNAVGGPKSWFSFFRRGAA